MKHKETFRPLANLWFGVLGQVLSVGFGVAAFIGPFEYRLLCLAITLSIISTLIFFRPKITFSIDHIEIVNPVTTHVVGWGAVDSFDTKNNFFITSEGKSIVAWAAPSSTRYASRGIHASELRGLMLDTNAGIKASQSPRSHSGVALAIAVRFFSESTKTNTEKTCTIDFKSVVMLIGAAVSFATALF